VKSGLFHVILPRQFNSAVRALDPDGRIQREAKQHSASREATPEEHHLVEQVKEMTRSVMQTVDYKQRRKFLARLMRRRSSILYRDC
jgi:hypothetical protein